MSIDWEYKIIRDPIYGYVGLTEKEICLLDLPVFQRLRNIKQLACTNLVYPSAVHSRFEHSLGTLYVANKIANRLSLDDVQKEIVRSAALLHDIGHGPFSHVFENILEIINEAKIDHTQITSEIIRSTKVWDVLGDIKEEVLEIFTERKKESVLRDIIASSLDADKLDYLRRDSYHTGVAYGIFDFDRIIHTLDVDPDKKHLVITEKGKDALESFRLARYLMHIQVYKHHVRAITDVMLTRAAEIAVREGSIDKNQFLWDNRQRFLEHFLKYDDYFFLREMQKLPTNTGILANMINNRCLLKRAYEREMNEQLSWQSRKELSKMTREGFRKIEDEIAQKAEVDRDFIVVYFQQIENPIYRDPDRYLSGKETPILIKKKDGKIVLFQEVSSISGAFLKYVGKLYVFCLPEDKDAVKRVAQQIEILK